MESKTNKWIQKIHMKKGALRDSLHIKKGENIPENKLEKATKSSNPLLAKRANLAKTLRGVRK